MAELYSNCYAFVLPSEMEGLSNALLEALSYGNCIITSDIPENLEVIEDAGLSFRSTNVHSLQEHAEAHYRAARNCRSLSTEGIRTQPAPV